MNNYYNFKAFKLYFSIIFFMLSSIQISAQHSYPKDYFRSPLDFRLLLSGTFGEFRANHFHSGIDIKTGGAEGKAVYAVAEGYVSRIKISIYGFGNAIYVTHPNGYVSVYGHLSRLNDKIGEYTREQQYQKETFEIELFPAPGELPVKKGEIIAYSGNSGSSGGPHLHFELRDGASQKPVNPLLFGYEVKDFYKPRITSIKIYPEDNYSTLNGKPDAKRFLVEGWGTEHNLAGNPSIKLSGNISFGIQVYDQQNDTDNKNGPYSVRVFIDDRKVYEHTMETFSFDDTRYINSMLDYREYIQNDVRLARTKIDPGNKLDIYGYTLNKGVYSFTDTLTHDIRFEVADVLENTAVLSFKAKSEKPANAGIAQKNAASPVKQAKFPSTQFNYASSNRYANGNVAVEAPAGTFYDSFTFTYDTAGRIPGTFSPVQIIHDKYTPVHDYINLSIKPVRLPATLEDKALVVKVNSDGKTYSSAGGKYDNRTGTVMSRIREFGNYTIAVDTIPPIIKAVSPENYTKMAGVKEIKLKVSDELSGIAGFRGSLNGQWILFEYDAKTDTMTYTVDDHLKPGKNTLLFEVADGKNNRSFFAATLIL